MTFPAAIANANAPDNRMRIGIVVSVNPLIVSVQGTPIPMGRSASFFPALNQSVAVIRQDGTWVAVDETQGSADIAPKMQAGSAIVVVTAATNATLAVVFARPFAAVPAVATNINSGSGLIALWGSRAINVTANGFTIFIFGAVAATINVDVQWQAQERTQ